SGEAVLEDRLAAIAKRQPRFVYLRGYAEGLSDTLYAAADLFLMPSTFEPCGISQLLALRSGQPCVVHAVGGLRDTVVDGETGFHFQGATPEEQARAFGGAVDRALRLRREAPEAWREMSKRAAAQRFDWERAARAYAEELYAQQA
ncbi:MAG: glycosyltransferase, partial [Gammaproteobacteria bacterium]